MTVYRILELVCFQTHKNSLAIHRILKLDEIQLLEQKKQAVNLF